MLTIVRDRAPLDTRIRSIVQTEMQNVGFFRTAEPTFRRGNPDAIAGPGRTLDRDVSAILTPFGVYRAGPAGLLTALVTLVSFLGVGVVLLFMLPKRLGRLRDTLSLSATRRLRLEAIGVLGYVLALALLLLLVGLVTGILFAAILAGLLAAGSFAGLVAVALALGRWLRARVAPAATSPVAELVLGVMAIFPLGLIPWLGWVLVPLLAAMGFGALIATKFGSEEGWSLDPLRGGQSLGI